MSRLAKVLHLKMRLPYILRVQYVNIIGNIRHYTYLASIEL